jgi:transcriptional regulator with XRE-family HTH domain
MKRETKIQSDLLYEGLGFPIHLQNCPMVKIYGEWMPAIDLSKLQDVMAVEVTLNPGRLCGAEVRFLRIFFGMTLQALAEEFGVTRQAVAKWERKGNELTGMGLAAERDFRMFALIRLDIEPEQLVRARKLLGPALQRSRIRRHIVNPGMIRNRRRIVQRRLQALSA